MSRLIANSPSFCRMSFRIRCICLMRALRTVRSISRSCAWRSRSQAWDRSKAHRATTIVGATTECQHTLDDHAHLVSHLLLVFLLVQHEALVLIPLLPRLKSFIVAPTAFVAPARVPLIVAPTYTSIVGLATDWCTYTCSNSAPFPLNLLCGNVHISLLSQC
jgi:hypothetical protein